MTAFSPIAIIGQGCVLPGALSPDALWEIISRGDDAITSAPEGYWGVDSEFVATKAEDPAPDATWTDRGGFVRGFDDSFDPQGFELPADQLTDLDPVFQWGLYAGRQALEGAGYDLGSTTGRGGVIFGNKSYPTHSLADFAENVWREQNDWPRRAEVDARNRFMSGLPAQLVARALGFEGHSFCLDVACASSLYAIKLACNRLQRGDADLMIAGGINRADDLFLRIGFCALQAISRTGQSRPFHRDADGLVPAEGAAVVVLKRLEDAVSQGDSILGVIRGVGLSNDGRSRGLLTPSQDGQIRSMKRAYETAGLTPSDLSLIECHAAGTALGDTTEIRSMAAVFDDVDKPLPVASMKSNLGHLITVSGAAGLLKIIAAIDHRVRPPTLNADEPIDALDDSPFRPLLESEKWECEGPRRAAINNFGFGGNNAHLIVEEWLPEKTSAPVEVDLQQGADDRSVAVVDISVVAADGEDRLDFARALFHGEPRLDDDATGRAQSIDLDLGKVRFPPLDLKKALPQQLMILEATLQLEDIICALPNEETGILLGMQCDAEIARYLVRWRLGEKLVDGDSDRRDGLIEALDAAGVLGTMPNLVTNRLNSQFDLKGASLTLSGEELSGMIALDLACRALRSGELDAAVVGAVDLSCEPVHRAAAADVLPEGRQIPGDAAVAMVLKRLDDARRDGDTVHAVFPAPTDRSDEVSGDEQWSVPDLTPLFGHSHATSGLLRIAAAVEASSRRALPARPEQPAVPWLPDHRRRRASISMKTVAGDRLSTTIEAPTSRPASALLESPAPRLHIYSGADHDELRQAMKNGDTSDGGPMRLVIVARSEEELLARQQSAIDGLDELPDRPSFSKIARGVYVGDGSLEGETAFVFTGPAGSYNGMGRQLVLAIPELADAFAARCRAVDRAAGWIYRRPTGETPGPGKKLWGASFLCQIHAQLSRGLLGIEPEAVIGFCAGETNALFAMGAWNDFDGLYEDLESEAIFEQKLGGQFQTVQRAWNLTDDGDVDWQTLRVLAPLDVVEAAVKDEEHCYITIVNAPGDCVVGGAADACARVIERIGKKRARPLGYNIAMHCPATRPVEKLWHEMHHRPTEPVPGVRFYTHSTLDHYEVDADKVADALVGQAMNRVDFPKLIDRAYDDGVRIFIEHGPRAGCTRWIGRILGERDHLAVSLDRTGRDSLTQTVNATAQLVAAGLDIDHEQLMSRLDDAITLPKFEDRDRKKKPKTLRFPAHLPPVQLPRQKTENRSQPAGVTASDTTAPDAVSEQSQPLLLPPVLPLPSAPVPALRTNGKAPVSASSSVHKTKSVPTNGAHKPVANHQTAGQVIPDQQISEPRATEPPQSGQPRTVEGQMAAMHDEFLRERAELHRDFMDQQRQAAQWFLQMYENRHEIHKSPSRAPGPGPNSSNAIQPSRPVPFPSQPTPSQPPPPPSPGSGRQDEQSTDNARQTLFDRQDLKTHASGRISEIFGPEFARQDDHHRQVRMPEPPLLLVDRVTGIDAEAGAMENKGIIWTETDVDDQAWYLHRGRMPVGITVEAGQADLMLISWMGADFQNQDRRVYRLLGCELTFHGELPRPGDTLEYEIHIDEHARQGEVRIFFFHYDCIIDGEVRLSMRNGQAGFFSDEELANSEGVLWSPGDLESPTEPPVQPPRTPNLRRFDKTKLKAFADGRVRECFGEGFERAATHTSTPAFQLGEMLFLDEVQDFDPRGGPHGRGYLRAVQHISPDTWFFDGHFKNDPCMPGTLMLEGCTQAMSFYLAGLGYTLERDGWRFEPAVEQPCAMRCRGQVTPRSKEVVYELFVRHIEDSPQPTLYADLLCTVDGLKAFHCERLALRLVPDWPLQWHPEWIDAEMAKSRNGDRPVATVDGFSFDQAALMACTLGKPSNAFGPMYRPFDSPRRAPRLPNPPYLFISRIAEIDATPEGMEKNSRVVAEYDVPSNGWYFDDGNSGSMPFCALMEVGLQPCGWLASYVGCALSSDAELFFRNLDGTGTVFGEVTPDTSILRTESNLRSISRSGSMIIVGFDVDTYADGELVFSMETVFGFFPAAALAQQDGLATGDELLQRIEETAPHTLDPYVDGLDESLSMFDRITGWWPEGGEAGLGRLRSEQDVDPGAWYFRSHFFQDPVQPGSLGVEAMLQLLQRYMLATGMDKDVEFPRFEPVLTDRAITWKYRGQVVPENDSVMLDMEITERSEPKSKAPYAVATASLWVDGTRIYEVRDLGMKIANDGTARSKDTDVVKETTVFDPDVDTWLKDHRPTFTRPALPMMSIADVLATAAADRHSDPVVELRDVHLHGWAVIDGPTEVTTETLNTDEGFEVRLSTPEKKIAVGQIRCASEWPEPPPPLDPLPATEEMDDPYETGAIFHGPAFQLLESGEMGESGCRAVLDAAAGDVPIGQLHPALLDAALHVIPHDRLEQWSDEISPDTVAYPHRIDHLTLHAPTPTSGKIGVEVRLVDFADGERFPTFHIQFFDGHRLWADLRLVELLFPKGRIAQGDPGPRRAFLRDRQFIAGFGVSRFDGDKTRLSVPEFRKNDWFEGTIATIYGVSGDLVEQARQVAIKDHLAQRLEVHPSRIAVDGTSATCPELPDEEFSVRVDRDGPMEFVVSNGP